MADKEAQQEVVPPGSIDGDSQVKKSVGHWKDNEEHVLPKNRLGIVFFGLMACTFLAALDQVSFSAFVQFGAAEWNFNTIHFQTIVATALPTIVAKLGGGKDYSWVGRYNSVFLCVKCHFHVF